MDCVLGIPIQQGLPGLAALPRMQGRRGSSGGWAAAVTQKAKRAAAGFFVNPVMYGCHKAVSCCGHVEDSAGK